MGKCLGEIAVLCIQYGEAGQDEADRGVVAAPGLFPDCEGAFVEGLGLDKPILDGE
jgi:hypothetical protein